MTARIQNAASQPDVTTGVRHLFKAIYAGGVPAATLELVHLRASQINGCSACVGAGVANAPKAGLSPEKPVTVSVKIGEDKQKGDPFGAAFKTMAAVYGLLSEFLGEGTIFAGN